MTVGEGASIGKPREEAKGITVVGTGIAIPAGRVIGDDEMIAELKEEA